MVAFKLCFLGFESKCLNVGTYAMQLFMGHMDFEFVKAC
jgi:hypothetical protein